MPKPARVVRVCEERVFPKVTSSRAQLRAGARDWIRSIVATAFIATVIACSAGTATLPPNEDGGVGNNTLPASCTPGESRPSPDGCNTCICEDSGASWACTKRACPKPGPDAAPACTKGERRPDADGCNECVCTDEGWACTQRACPLDAGGAGCSGPGTCAIVPRTCCGQCGAATPSDHVALPRSQTNAYVTSVCGGNQGCPACAADELTFGAMQAQCVAGACRAIFVPDDPISVCTKDEDCTARWADCCGMGGRGVVAIRADKQNEFNAMVCPNSPGCGNAPPPELPFRATCSTAKGHCVVIRK